MFALHKTQNLTPGSKKKTSFATDSSRYPAQPKRSPRSQDQRGPWATADWTFASPFDLGRNHTGQNAVLKQAHTVSNKRAGITKQIGCIASARLLRPCCNPWEYWWKRRRNSCVIRHQRIAMRVRKGSDDRQEASSRHRSLLYS